MAKKLIFLLFVFLGVEISAQEAISGYVEVNQPEDWRVHLSEISLKELPKIEKSGLVAVSELQQDGFFSFERTVLKTEEKAYVLELKNLKKSLDSQKKQRQLLLISNEDTVRFFKGEKPLNEYITSNQADREWYRLRNVAFANPEFRLTASRDLSTKNLRSYTRDSLRILRVKLISLKELDQQNLLDLDIKENPDYYINLLDKLKSSDISRTEYLFLEDKLSALIKARNSANFRWSLGLNLALALVVFALLWIVLDLRRKSKTITTLPLSKQERKIHRLILEGKTNKEIATELFISVSTVKTHITNIYQKLNIANREELLNGA